MRTHTRTWNQALDEGHNPSEYEARDMPEGEWTGRLDFKVWTKTGAGLGCYFTKEDDGQRYRLTAFRPKVTGEKEYTPKDQEIDFSDDAAAPGDRFCLEVGRTRNGSVKWISARRVG